MRRPAVPVEGGSGELDAYAPDAISVDDTVPAIFYGGGAPGERAGVHRSSLGRSDPWTSGSFSGRMPAVLLR